MAPTARKTTLKSAKIPSLRPGPFPRLFERGLIEARPMPGTHFPVLLFPRLFERGLIEAPTLHFAQFLRPIAFRVYLNAASLKPVDMSNDADFTTGAFRVYLNAASLKR